MMPEWSIQVIDYAIVGIKVTLGLFFWSGVLSLLLGILLGALASISSAMAFVVAVYNQVWRGIPVLVTLFALFFLLPVLGLTPSSFVTVVIGLSLWGSANIAEIVLGSIRSVPASQMNAAVALGFKPVAALRYVVVPQAVRRILPSAVGVLVILVQATSLASAIGGLDLLESVNRSIERLAAETGESHALVIYAAILAVYFMICAPLTYASRWLERRYE